VASFDKLVISFLVDEVAGGFFVDVPPGHIATLYDKGRGVLKNTWGPGLHFKIPFWQKAKVFNAQTIEYTIRKGFDSEENKEALGDDPITASTADNISVVVEGTVLVRINKESIVGLWENIGENFVSKIIRPVSRSRVRTGLSDFTFAQLNSSSRHDAEARIKQQLELELGPKGLIVEGVLLSDITQPNSNDIN
jgi:regulator of protease activity HflC (stomatin/prohibitin superfamily)